jgi:hypothetical protein
MCFLFIHLNLLFFLYRSSPQIAEEMSVPLSELGFQNMFHLTETPISSNVFFMYVIDTTQLQWQLGSTMENDFYIYILLLVFPLDLSLPIMEYMSISTATSLIWRFGYYSSKRQVRPVVNAHSVEAKHTSH